VLAERRQAGRRLEGVVNVECGGAVVIRWTGIAPPKTDSRQAELSPGGE
jgi:hypothetical protein